MAMLYINLKEGSIKVLIKYQGIKFELMQIIPHLNKMISKKNLISKLAMKRIINRGSTTANSSPTLVGN